ncbi:MAG TPA: hypothetical protein VI277_07290 [Candidatus Limnocylindria bacterium]
MSRRAIGIVIVVGVALTGCVADTRPEACDADEVTIELTVTADSMTPGNPGVCREQEVTLVIDSEADGFLHVHGYDQALPAIEVVAGEEVEVDFVADRSGQFPIELHLTDDPAGVDIGILTVYEP